MRFRVVPNSSSVPSEGRDVGYLLTYNWNDWFKYRTLYVLTYFDPAGNKHDIGNVKIGQFRWNDQQDRPRIPATFERLGQQFFFTWTRLVVSIWITISHANYCQL